MCTGYTNMVSVLNRVSHKQLQKVQMEDTDIVTVIQYIKSHNKAASFARIRRFKSPVIRRYLYFEQFVLIKGMLHWTYRQYEAEYYQLEITPKLKPEVLKMLHEDQGYQAIEWTFYYYFASTSIESPCMQMPTVGYRIVIAVKQLRIHL